MGGWVGRWVSYLLAFVACDTPINPPTGVASPIQVILHYIQHNLELGEDEDLLCGWVGGGGLVGWRRRRFE